MKVTIEGDRELFRALNGITRAGLNTAPAMQLIAETWRGLAQGGFRSGSDPYGNSWKAVHRNGQPLRDTGRLQRSIEGRGSKTRATTGTNVCYAIVHQEGATITADAGKHVGLCGTETKNAPWLRFKINGKWAASRKVVIPQRRIFPDEEGGGLPRNWEDDAAEILVGHLNKGAKA